MSDPSSVPDATDEQATAESLDDDVVEVSEYPPEELQGADEFGTTADEEWGGESVAERDDRYDHRDDLRGDAPPLAGLLDEDDEFEEDETAELVAVEGDEPDSYSAEEAAVHLADDGGGLPDSEVLGLDAASLDDRRD